MTLITSCISLFGVAPYVSRASFQAPPPTESSSAIALRCTDRGRGCEVGRMTSLGGRGLGCEGGGARGFPSSRGRRRFRSQPRPLFLSLSIPLYSYLFFDLSVSCSLYSTLLSLLPRSFPLVPDSGSLRHALSTPVWRRFRLARMLQGLGARRRGQRGFIDVVCVCLCFSGLLFSFPFSLYFLSLSLLIFLPLPFSLYVLSVFPFPLYFLSLSLP